MIEVYADVWCPFTHVGLRRLVRRRHELGRDDERLMVHACPLELVNLRPQDARTTLEHIELLRAQVAPELFERFDPDRFPKSTLEALELASAAYRNDPVVGEQVSLELRDLLFEQGVDVSSPSVLAELARRYGLTTGTVDREAVLDDWHRGQARGVQGSPHFFCEDRDVFCPTLDLSRDAGGAMQIEERSDRLFAFIEGCFAS